MTEEAIGLLHFKDDPGEVIKMFDSLSFRAKVVILDDVEASSTAFMETAVRHMRQMSATVTFLLVTKRAPKTIGTPVLSISTSGRLESSFLGYILRRRVLSLEALSLKANDSMIVAVNWLNRVHVQLLEYCQKYALVMPSMKYFLVKDLPLESSHQFRIWFVDLWNLVLVQQFKAQIQDQVIQDNQVVIKDDPVRLVARTWPWKDQDGGLCGSLRPICDNEDIFNKDPLVNNLFKN